MAAEEDEAAEEDWSAEEVSPKRMASLKRVLADNSIFGESRSICLFFKESSVLG